jgi:hypothetical protein
LRLRTITNETKTKKPMKKKPQTVLTAFAAVIAMTFASPVFAEEEHGHDEHKGHAHEKKIAGPNGGRVLTKVEPHLEFFVTKDHKVQITAVNDKGKAIPLAAQFVRVIGGSRSKPTILSFTKKGNTLISDKAFPKGKNLPVVVQVKVKPGAKTVIEKFSLNLSDCPGCDYLEYACTCDHDH